MIKRIGCLLLVVVMASGCAMTASQKEQVARFGKATEAVGAFAEEEFPGIRNDVIEMNTAALVLSPDRKDPEINLDRPTSANSAARRLAAARALKSYGSLLNELATAERAESIKATALEVVDTFDSSLEQGLSDEQKDAAAGVITSLGGIWIEKKKKDAVKAIVTAYNEPVQILADLLLEDFKANGMGYLGGYTAVAGQLENKAVGLLTGGELATLEDRELVVDALVVAKAARKRAKEVEVVAQQAISNLKSANTQLVEVMKQDDYASEDFKAYAKSVQDLVNMTEVLGNH